MCGRAVKTLVLHLSLAHRDWLPVGQLPPGHALTVQHTLHMLLGAGRGCPGHCVVLAVLACCPAVLRSFKGCDSSKFIAWLVGLSLIGQVTP